MAIDGRDSNELSVEEARPFLLEKDDELPLPATSPRPVLASLGFKFWFSVVVNCIATVGIVSLLRDIVDWVGANSVQVFVNKHIFSDESLRRAQVAFAAFHFATTGLFHYLTSRPAPKKIMLFEAKKLDAWLILPLALAMIFNVLLPNASLANSSIQFYQIARILVTPVVALLNYILYQSKISSRAAFTLVPVCVGVAVVSYFDTVPRSGADTKPTTMIGVFFAFSGVIATAIYTVWVKKYLQKLECSTSQLLLNISPLSVLVMLYIIPFSDDVTVFSSIELPSWLLIQLSGIFACMITTSQYVIINEAGPVSSTVVGHFKNCSIIALAWLVSRKSPEGGSVVGIVLAMGGIIAYTYFEKQQARK